MEITINANQINIKMKKLNLEIIKNFMQQYKELFNNFEKTKNKTLQFIEEKDLEIENKANILYLTAFLYRNFKDIHELYIKNIEFIFTTKIYYNLFKSVSLIYPLKHDYTISLIE